MPKYVASSTLADPEWTNTTALEGDAASAVRLLKERTDGDILVYGSAELTYALSTTSSTNGG
jgi:dihydrofolate reductase